MLGINLKSDLDRVLDEVGVFDLEEQRRATMRALNRASRGVVTDASSKIRDRFSQLKKRDVDAAFSIASATMDNPRAEITARGRPLSLARFLAREITTRGKGGVWVNVKGERKFIPHVWAQTLKNKAGEDYIVLMARVGKDRYPVEVLRTINIPDAFLLVIELIEPLAVERFDEELARNLRFLEGKR